MLAEHLGDALGEAVALGRDEHRPVIGDEAAQLGDGLLGVAPEGRRDLEAEVEGVALVVAGERREVEPAHAEVTGLLAQLGQRAEGGRAEDGLEVDRHGVAARGVGPPGVEELLARRDEVVGAGADPFGVARDEQRTLREDVEEGLHAVDQRGGQRLHPLDGDALRELLEEVGGAGQGVGEGGGTCAHGIREEQLAARWRPQALLRHLERALVGDLEPADLLDGVAPELQAQRVLLGGREDVEDAAAHRELPAALDEVGAGVGRAREALDDLLERGLVAGAQGDGAQLAQPLGDRLEHGPHRGDDDGRRTVPVVGGLRVGQAPEHRQALADGVAARAESLVRERLPRGEVGDRPGAEAGLEGGLEVLRLASRRGDGEDGGAAVRRGEGGDEEVAGPRRGRGDDLGTAGRRGPPTRREVPGSAATRARRADNEGIPTMLVVATDVPRTRGAGPGPAGAGVTQHDGVRRTGERPARPGGRRGCRPSTRR